MPPLAFFTTGRVARAPPPLHEHGALARWLEETFGEALFVMQRGHVLRFARVAQRAGVEPYLVIAPRLDPAPSEEVAVSVAALRERSVQPCIVKVFISLFNTPVRGTSGDLTAKQAKAEPGSIKKIVVSRARAPGSGSASSQSILTVASFLQQIASALTPAVLMEAPAGGERQVEERTPGTEPAQAPECVSWSSRQKLSDLARILEVFPSAEPSLPWTEAEEFLSAALGKQVSGKAAVIAAAAKLNHKLTAGTAVRTALASALDAARESCVALTLRDKGEILAELGIPSATASPAARAQAGAPARQPAADAQAQGQQQPARDSAGVGVGEDSESSGSDSYESDTASEDDGPARPASGHAERRESGAGRSPKRKRPKKHKKSKRRKKPRSSSPEAFSPDADLAKLTPAGMQASQVAKVLFSDPALAQAAQYVEQPPESGSDDEDVAQWRTAFAVRRLKEACGTAWIPQEPVGSKKELKLVREHVAHLIAQRAIGARDVPGPSASSSSARPQSESARSRPIHLDDAEPTLTLSTGAAALPSEVKAAAVLPDVVERLHESGAHVRYEQGDDVGAGIRGAPENLRADLARAVGSNGRVDAAGEHRAPRIIMPRVVVRMARTLVDEVQKALQQLAEDEPEHQYMFAKPARKLAEAAVSGHFNLPDWTKEVAAVLGPRSAPKSGSILEVNYAWRYIRVALLTVAAALYDMRGTFQGLERVDNRLGETAGPLLLDAQELRVWLRRVLESWELAVYRFRKGAPQVPSFAECVCEHEKYFKFTSLVASLREEAAQSRGDGRRDYSQRDQRDRGRRGLGAVARRRRR